jgi:tRNA threonylcarbamoyladenosine biosynthesis protein TsaE
LKIESKSVKETLSIGRAVARNLRPQDIICLFGRFGSGKTILTKGIAWGLGLRMDDIISPSFVLIREHRKARIPLIHFDLYRLKSAKDILGLGYEGYLYEDGVSVIEWADRLKYLMPKSYLRIDLFIKGKTKRRLEFSAFGGRYKELLRAIKKKVKAL